MGAAAGDEGVCRIILPHYQLDDLEQMLAWEQQDAHRDDAPFETLIALTRDYFNAKVVDFAQVVCAMPAPTTLGGKVLRACREIPYGQTVSYSGLARQIGSPDAARAVAAALGKNPTPLVIPCHRVTYAGGRLGGFTAPGGTELKARMLDLEKLNAPA